MNPGPEVRGLGPGWGALLFAVVTAAAGAALATTGADLQPAALAGGIVVATAVIGAAVTVRSSDRGSLPAVSLLGLPVLTLVALAAAFAGAAALPHDLHLRTVGRPPSLLIPLALSLSAALAAAFLAVRRGAPPARAGLTLLVPLVTLEGLPIGAPPGLGLAVAGTILLLSAMLRPARVPGLLPIGALLGAFAVSTFLGADPGPGVDVLTRLLALFATFVVLASDPEPKAAARLAVRTLLATVSLVALAGLASRGLLYLSVNDLGIDAFGTELSLFGRHPNTIAPWFGAAAVLALPIALSGRGGDRLLALVTLPLATTTLFLTASRLAIGATLVAVILISIRRTRLLRALIRTGVAVAVVVSAALLLPAFRDKIQNRENHPHILAESHRVHRMEVAWRAAADRPWIGHGPRTWFVQGRFVPPSRFDGESSADHPHDLPLALLEGSGGLGLAFFLIVLLTMASWARRALRAEDAEVRMLATGVTFALVAQLLTNLLDMGDALDTFIPSRLLIDAGLLAALARAAESGSTGVRPPRPVLAISGAAAAALGVVSVVGVALVQRGSALAARGDGAAAAVTLERAATLRPFDADVRLQLVAVWFQQQNLRFARENLDEAEALAPDRPSLHETRAQLFRANGDDRTALQAIDRAHELDPRGAAGARLAPTLAELRLAIGDRDEGIAAAATAIWQSPDVVDAWAVPARSDVLRIGRVEVPLADVMTALTTMVDEDAAHRLRRRLPFREAEVHLRLGRYDDAYAALERLEALDGEATSNRLLFEARVARTAGDLDRSRSAAERSLAAHAHPSLELELGQTLHAAGLHRDALAAYRRALALSLDAHFVEGIYRDLLDHLCVVLEVVSEPAERVVALRHLAFFSADGLDRAAVLIRLGEARAAIDAGAGSDDLRHALRLVLAAPATDRARGLALDLGRRLAAAGADASSPSRYADGLERFAERRGAGVVLHAFRVALLEGLGLTERAAAAKRELAAAR